MNNLLHRALSLLLTCGTALTALAAEPPLRFNEIMQSNVYQLMYADDFPDSWVELHNTTDRTVNLHHCYIGTTADVNEAYRLEHFLAIPPQGYTLIYCDKADDRWVHTDFRLETTSKGRLYLWDSNAQLLDSLTYPKMPAPDVAYGRRSDGTWSHLLTATPALPNCEATGPLLPHPTFSTEGCLLSPGQQLTLHIAAPTHASLPADARLLVTTDGSLPTPDAAQAYDPSEGAHLQIGHTTVVRARLWSAQGIVRLPVTHSYIAHPRATTLPILSLATDSALLYGERYGILVGNDWNANCYKEWRRPVNIEYYEPTAPDEAIINQMGETKTHGVGSLLFSQKSLNLYAHKRFGGPKKFDTHTFWPDKPGVTQSKTFCIRNGGNRCLDSRFEDAFAQLLFGQHLDTLQYQAYRPVIAYINGRYRGIYGLRERSHESWVENNVGVDEDDVTVTESLYYNDLRRLIDDPATTYADLASRIDMPLMLNYLCAEAYATNDDYPHNNVWMWRQTSDPADRWHPLLKDLDYASTTVRSNWFNLMLVRYPESGAVVDALSHRLLIRLMEMREFREPFLDRMQTYLGDFCKPSVTVPMIYRMRQEIEAEIGPTFDVLTEAVTRADFDRRFDLTLLPYCQQWPMHLYACMASTFGLGNVVRLTVSTTTDRGDTLPVSINSVRLTEGDYDGACYSGRRTMIDSGDSSYGWLMEAQLADGTVIRQQYASGHITLVANGLLSRATAIRFTPVRTHDAGIIDVRADGDDEAQDAVGYDLMGRRVQKNATGCAVVRPRVGVRIIR